MSASSTSTTITTTTPLLATTPLPTAPTDLLDGGSYTASSSTPNDHRRHGGYNGNNPEIPKASATAFLSCVIGVFVLALFWHLFYIYVIRRRPYYYSVQSDVDPTIWHVERVVPVRERIRQWRGLPRSDSDAFRDEDLERVRSALMVRGWRGRVNSDGTPNRNHRVIDDRAAGAGGAWGYTRNFCDDPEYGPRQYVEQEDTPFWRDRRWGHAAHGTYGISPNERMKNYGSFRAGSPGRGRFIPVGLSSNQWPTGIVTPEFGSFGKDAAAVHAGYGLNAAFSYQASPRNTRFVTPPIRASSKILEELKHTGLRYTTDRSAKFPDEDLQEHYKGLCESEDAALRELEEARTAAAVEHTYNRAASDEPHHAQRVVEKLTVLEKKLLHALKRRTLFAERFASKDETVAFGHEQQGESSRGPSVSEPPPPYTDVDENGLRFDEEEI